MSNLDYSIALLSIEKSKLDVWQRKTKKQKGCLQAGISRAMKILLEEKRKDEKKGKDHLDYE